jgi:hypothetical protein
MYPVLRTPKRLPRFSREPFCPRPNPLGLVEGDFACELRMNGVLGSSSATNFALWSTYCSSGYTHPPTGVCCDRYSKFPTLEPRESPVPNAEGDAESFGWQEGESFPLDESYCKWVLEGRIPDVVPDARREDVTKDLRVTLSCSPMLAYSLFQWGGEKRVPRPARRSFLRLR